MKHLLLLFVLAGCASMVHVEPGELTIGRELVVRSDGRWNRVEPPQSEADASEVWTADGVTLDMVLFYVGIEDGTLGFRSSMLPHEVVELYESLVAQDGSLFRLERLAPARLGTTRGFVFEHLTTTRGGLVLRGLAYGAIVDERLYLISYTAPDSHLFAKHLAAVQALAASAQIRRRGSAAFASP